MKLEFYMKNLRIKFAENGMLVEVKSINIQF